MHFNPRGKPRARVPFRARESDGHREKTLLSDYLHLIHYGKHSPSNISIMKTIYFLSCALLFSLLALPLQATNAPLRTATAEPSSEAMVATNKLMTSIHAWEDFKANKSEMSREERRTTRRALKKDLRKAKKDFRSEAASDDLLLLIIVTILIPPLGMYLYEGSATNRFWISLVLTLLFYVPGLIYSLFVILDEN